LKNPSGKIKQILKIDDSNKIIFDDFRDIKLEEKADLVFAGLHLGLASKVIFKLIIESLMHCLMLRFP